PEYRDEWRSRPNYRQLRLDPLASETLEELLRALLGSDPSLTTVKDFLAERASGNPFFAEEIVRALAGARVIEGARGSYRLARPFSSIEGRPPCRRCAKRVSTRCPPPRGACYMRRRSSDKIRRSPYCTQLVASRRTRFAVCSTICRLPNFFT